MTAELFGAYFADAVVVGICHINISLCRNAQSVGYKEFCNASFTILISIDGSGNSGDNSFLFYYLPLQKQPYANKNRMNVLYALHNYKIKNKKRFSLTSTS